MCGQPTPDAVVREVLCWKEYFWCVLENTFSKHIYQNIQSQPIVKKPQVPSRPHPAREGRTWTQFKGCERRIENLRVLFNELCDFFMSKQTCAIGSRLSEEGRRDINYEKEKKILTNNFTHLDSMKYILNPDEWMSLARRIVRGVPMQMKVLLKG